MVIKRAPQAVGVEAPECNGVRTVQFPEQDAGYQVAGNDKEYVDADEATRKAWNSGVRSDD